MAEPGGTGYLIQDVVAYPPGLLSLIRRLCTHDAIHNDSIILQVLHEKFDDHPLRLSIVRRLRSILTEFTAKLTDKIELRRSTQVKMADCLRMDMEPELENSLARFATKTLALGREMEILQSIQARATEFEMAFEAETGSSSNTQNEQPETDATRAAQKQQQSILAPSLVVEKETSSPTQASLEECDMLITVEPDVANESNYGIEKEEAPRKEAGEDFVERRQTGTVDTPEVDPTSLAQTSITADPIGGRRVHEKDEAGTDDPIRAPYYSKSSTEGREEGTISSPNTENGEAAVSMTQVADASLEATKGILGIHNTRVVGGDEDPQAVQGWTDDPSQGGPETAGDTTTSKGGDDGKASIKATEAVHGNTPFTREIVANDEEAQLTHEEADIPSRAAAETVERTTTSSKGDDDEILDVENSQPERFVTRGEGDSGAARNGIDHDGVVQDLDHNPEDGEHTKIVSPEDNVDPLSSAIEESTKPEPGQIQPSLYDAESALELSKASRRSRRANAEVLRRNDAAFTIATALAKLREIAAEANEALDEPEEGGEGQGEGARFTFDKSLPTVGPRTIAPLTGAVQTVPSDKDAKNHRSALSDDVLADPAPTHSDSFAGKHEEEDLSIYEDPPPEKGGAANVRELETTVTITDRSDVCDQEVSTGRAVSLCPSSSRDASDALHRSPSASPEDTSTLSSPVSELSDPFDQLQRTAQIEANDGTAVTDQRPRVTNETEIARQKFITRIEQNWNRSINDVLQHPVWPNKNGRLGRVFLYNVARLSDMHNNFEDAMAMLERDVFDQQNTHPHKWQRNHATTLTIKRVLRPQSPTKHIPLNTWHLESGGGSAAKGASADDVDTTVAAESSLQTQENSEAKRNAECEPALPANDGRQPRPYSKQEIALLVKLNEDDKLSWKAIAERFHGRRTEGSLRQTYRWHKEEAAHVRNRKARIAPGLISEIQNADRLTESPLPAGDESNDKAESEQQDEMETLVSQTDPQTTTLQDAAAGHHVSNSADVQPPEDTLSAIALKLRAISQSQLYLDAMAMLSQNEEDVLRHGLGFVVAEWAKAIFENDKALCFQRIDAISDVLAMVIRHQMLPLEERWAAVQDMDQEMTNFVYDRGGLGVMDTNRKVMPMVFGEMRKAWASKQSPSLRCVENMLAANPRPEKRGPVEEAIAFAAQRLRSFTALSLDWMEAAAYDLFEAILANDRARHNLKVKQSALSSLLEAVHRANQAAHREVASTAGDANNSSKGGESLHAEQHCAASDEVEAVAEATPKPARSPVMPGVVSTPSPSDHESEEEDREKEGSPPGSEETEKRNVVDTILEDARDLETGSTSGSSDELPQIVESEDVPDYSQRIIDLEAHAPPQEAPTHKCDSITNNGQRCNALMSSAQLLLAHLNTVHNLPKEDVWCDICLGGKIFCRTDALWRHIRDVHHDVSPPPSTGTTAAAQGMNTTIGFNPQDSDASSSNNDMATPSFDIRLTILGEEDVKQIVAEMLKRPVNAPNYAIEVGLAVLNGRGDTIAGLKAVSKDLKAGINKYVADPSMREKTLSALEQAVREHMRAKGLVDIALRNAVPTTQQTQSSHEISTVQTTDEEASTVPSDGPDENYLAPSMDNNGMATTAARPPTLNSSGVDPNEVAADILAANADPRERGATYAPFEIAMRYFQARRPETRANLEMIASELLHCIPNAAKQLYPSRAKDCALEAVGNAKAAYIGKIDLESKAPLVGHLVTTPAAAPDPAGRSILSLDLPPATIAASPPAALLSLDQQNSNPDDVAARILTARDAIDMALQYLKSRKPEAVAAMETIAFELWQCITTAAKQLPQENTRKMEACAHDALEAAMDIYIEQNNLESRDFPAGTSSQLPQAPAPVPVEMSISNTTLSPTRTASDVPPSSFSDHDAAKLGETLLQCALPLTSSDASPTRAGVTPSGRCNSHVRKSDYTPAASDATVERRNTCAAKPPPTKAYEHSAAPDSLLDIASMRDAEQSGTAVLEQAPKDVSGAPQKLQLENIVRPRKRRTEPRKKIAAPRTTRPRDIDMVTQVQSSDSVEDAPHATLSLASEKYPNDNHDIPPMPPQGIAKCLPPVAPAPNLLPPRPRKVWDGASFVVTVDPVATASQNNSTARSVSQPLSPQPPPSVDVEQTPPAPSAVSPGFNCTRCRVLRPAATFQMKNNGGRSTTCCSAIPRNRETDTEAVTPGRKHRHISPGVPSKKDREDLDNHPVSNSHTTAKSGNFPSSNRAYVPTKPGNPNVNTKEKGAELAPLHGQVRAREEHPETAAGTPGTTSASLKRTRGIDTEATPTSPVKLYLPAPIQRSSSDIAGDKSSDVTGSWMRDERKIVQANKEILAGLKAYGEIDSLTSSNDSASQTQLPGHELTDTPTSPGESLTNARDAALKRQEADAAERRKDNALIKAREKLSSGLRAKNAATGTSWMASTSHSRVQRAGDEPTLASPTHVEPTPAPVPTLSSQYHSHRIPQRTVAPCRPLAPKPSQKKQNGNAAQVNIASSKQPPRCHTTSNEVAAAANSGFSVHGAPSDTVSNVNVVSSNSSIFLEPSHPHIINPQAAFTQHVVAPKHTIWIGPPRPRQPKTNNERQPAPPYVRPSTPHVEDYEPIPPNLNIEPPSRTPSPFFPNVSPIAFQLAEPSAKVREMLAPVIPWDTQNKESKKRRKEERKRRLRGYEDAGYVKDELLVLGDSEEEDVWWDEREPKRIRFTHGVGVRVGVGH